MAGGRDRGDLAARQLVFLLPGKRGRRVGLGRWWRQRQRGFFFFPDNLAKVFLYNKHVTSFTVCELSEPSLSLSFLGLLVAPFP